MAYERDIRSDESIYIPGVTDTRISSITAFLTPYLSQEKSDQLTALLPVVQNIARKVGLHERAVNPYTSAGLERGAGLYAVASRYNHAQFESHPRYQEQLAKIMSKDDRRYALQDTRLASYGFPNEAFVRLMHHVFPESRAYPGGIDAWMADVYIPLRNHGSHIITLPLNPRETDLLLQTIEHEMQLHQGTLTRFSGLAHKGEKVQYGVVEKGTSPLVAAHEEAHLEHDSFCVSAAGTLLNEAMTEMTAYTKVMNGFDIFTTPRLPSYPVHLVILQDIVCANPGLLAVLKARYDNAHFLTSKRYLTVVINTFGLEGLYYILFMHPGWDNKSAKLLYDAGFEKPSSAPFLSES